MRRREADPTVKRVSFTENAIRRNMVVVDLSKLNPNSPPPNEEQVKLLLKEIKSVGKKSNKRAALRRLRK